VPVQKQVKRKIKVALKVKRHENRKNSMKGNAYSHHPKDDSLTGIQ
jgi:hypothetical protein